MSFAVDVKSEKSPERIEEDGACMMMSVLPDSVDRLPHVSLKRGRIWSPANQQQYKGTAHIVELGSSRMVICRSCIKNLL